MDISGTSESSSASVESVSAEVPLVLPPFDVEKVIQQSRARYNDRLENDEKMIDTGYFIILLVEFGRVKNKWEGLTLSGQMEERVTRSINLRRLLASSQIYAYNRTLGRFSDARDTTVLCNSLKAAGGNMKLLDYTD